MFLIIAYVVVGVIAYRFVQRTPWTGVRDRLRMVVAGFASEFGALSPAYEHDLRDERARLLDEVDDVINTAQELSRSFTDEERVRHDVAVASIERIDRQLFGPSGAPAHRGSVNVNRNSTAATPYATRSLDELLWATNERVAAGTVSQNGVFGVDQRGATVEVDRVIVRSADNSLAVPAPRLNELDPSYQGTVRSFQQTCADMAIFGLMVDKTAHTSAQGFEVARSHKLYADRWRSICRALDVDTAGEGANWVPTGIGATMHEKVRAAGKVAPLFTRIDLPQNPWVWPIEGGDAIAYRVGEPTGDTEPKMTASTPGTLKATFDAEIFGGRVLFSRSVEADSAVAMLPFVQGKLVRAFVIAEERAILDGDTDGTHQDSDVGASATDARTAWDGLRKKALAQTVATATSATALNLGIVRKAMGKWGVNPSDLAFIIGVSNLHALLADTNLLTVDKMGPQAVLLNGQIGSVFGVPVIVSEYVREDLNASGVYDGITTTKTYMLAVNRNEWAIGQRMALDVEVDDSIYRETFQRVVVAFERVDMQNIGDAATNEDTAIAFNVTP